MDKSIYFVCLLINYFLDQDLQAYGGPNVECIGDKCRTIPHGEFPFPIIDDSDRKIAKQLGMIDPDEFDNKGLPLTARAVSFILFYFSNFEIFL